MRLRFALAALVAAAGLPAAPSAATTVTVDFFDAGFFGEDGRSSKEDGEATGAPTTPGGGFSNYHAGLSSGYGSPPFPDSEVRNFFVFDWADVLTELGGPLPGPIASATLHLYNPGVPEDGAAGYVSPDGSETFFLSDTGAKSPGEVMDHYDHPLSAGPFGGTDEGGDAAAVWGELASGPEFGTATMSPLDNGTYVDIVFTPIGVDFLNIKLGEFSGGGDTFFAFGGKLLSFDPAAIPDGDDDPDEIVFGFTHPNGFGSPDTSATVPMLTLTFVPEPGTGALLGIGLAGLAARRRRPGR